MHEISFVILACYPDKGMKSCGSKGLLDFGKKKLLQYQLDAIQKNKPTDSEILVISDCDTFKIKKLFHTQSKIIPLENYNPIYTGCLYAKYKKIVFIDYGCIFKSGTIKKNIYDKSCVLCVDKQPKLDIGCIVEKNQIQHIFYDLPDNKFSKIFSLCEQDKKKILLNNNLSYFNLLPFEIINSLIETGSVFDINHIKSEDFMYFNHMRQKNDVTKFIKKLN